MLTRTPDPSSGSVVHHCRLRSSVTKINGSREGVNEPAAAIDWTFAITAPSSARRVPLSRPSERVPAAYAPAYRVYSADEIWPLCCSARSADETEGGAAARACESARAAPARADAAPAEPVAESAIDAA